MFASDSTLGGEMYKWNRNNSTKIELTIIIMKHIKLITELKVHRWLQISQNDFIEDGYK